MSFKIDDSNYQFYRNVYEVLCKHVDKDLYKFITPENHPIAVLNSWERENRSIAKRGLKAGLLDVLSRIPNFSPSTISDINADLLQNGLPNLTKLMAVIKNTIQKVLHAKRIKNIEQFYIVKEVVDDTISATTTEERIALSKYLADFESSVKLL